MTTNTTEDEDKADARGDTGETTRYRDRVNNHRRKTSLRLGTTPATIRMRWRRLAKTPYQWKVLQQN